MSERASPFVAYTNQYAINGGNDGWSSICRKPEHGYKVPVVVTPLLPDDPRPGETWVDDYGIEYRIVGPPCEGARGERVMATRRGTGETYTVLIDSLLRKPALKTYQINLTDAEMRVIKQMNWSMTDAEKKLLVKFRDAREVE